MASFRVNDLDGLMLDLHAVSELPEEVAEAMLDAEAEVVEAAQLYTGMTAGVYRKIGGGTTLHSIGRGRMKTARGGGRVKYVYPRGKNAQGVRNAEVAFINEFGAPERGIAPRPFVGPANEAAADAAVDAAAEVYDEFLKTKNL